MKPVRVKYMLRGMRVELKNKLFIWEKTTDKFYIDTYVLLKIQSKKTGSEAVQSTCLIRANNNKILNTLWHNDKSN